ncbi:arginase family protein [Fusobacterium simiae]|jgi:Arginase/agmatinase/formimionoglutamate hydrolase, arginase family|uniref:Arginase family protein n=1 Tax=Fusobacterium simiae TaxID=855 RepID=A0ABT4DI45_FUSSI|nr:arginase family protein [Fusobacterium simiae]MCY7008274.1 arginase family protein [Fusobacterium simiae]
MKTIRLLYPDFVSGGLETYFFGANLLQYILPQNENQEVYKVNIEAPSGKKYVITDGIYGKEEVIKGIKEAMKVLEDVNPDKVITIGGNCVVSQAPFDYLHGKYENLGIIWIDTHPDVSTVNDGYPNAHAFVLGSLLGEEETKITKLMKNKKFTSDQVLYVGLQEIHKYQEKFLKEKNINYKIQTDEFLTNEEIKDFIKKFDHILVHLDIDVLDENLFHSTYFANKELVGDGSGSGKMTMEKLSEILSVIDKNANVVGFTIAEYLPFDEHKLNKMFSNISMFTK